METHDTDPMPPSRTPGTEAPVADATGRATLRDVAALAGVAKVTASVILNGSRSDTKVSAATRERILEAAARLQYRPNEIARSLSRRRSNVIGFFSHYGYFIFENPFLGTVLGALQRQCDFHKNDLMLLGGFPERSAGDVYNALTNGKIDGLVYSGKPGTPLATLLGEGDFPAISIADPTPGMPAAVVDDAGGSHLIAAHLHERGHRRVMYRASLPPVHLSGEFRRAGFTCAAQELGMEVICTLPETHWGALSDDEKRLITMPTGQRPTAIACWNDPFAYRALAFCREVGLRVPEDIAIAGFDGVAVPPLIPVAYTLTTLVAPWDQVARTAVDLLLDSVEKRPVPASTVFPVKLLIGDTT